MTGLIWVTTSVVLFGLSWWLDRYALTDGAVGLVVVAAVGALLLATGVVNRRVRDQFEAVGARMKPWTRPDTTTVLLLLLIVGNFTPMAHYLVQAMVLGGIVGMGWVVAQVVRPRALATESAEE